MVFLPAPRWKVGIRISNCRPYLIRSDTFAVAVDFQVSSLPACILRLKSNQIVYSMSQNGSCSFKIHCRTFIFRTCHDSDHAIL